MNHIKSYYFRSLLNFENYKYVYLYFVNEPLITTKSFKTDYLLCM